MKDFSKFPAEARERAAVALTFIAEGATPDIAKPMSGLGGGVWELAIRSRGDAYRIVYALQLAEEIRVVHAFQKKSKKGIATPKPEIDLIVERIKRLKGLPGMTKTKQAVVRGSGNVFRDLQLPNAELLQLKALLGAEVVRAMDELGLGARDAERATKIAAA